MNLSSLGAFQDCFLFLYFQITMPQAMTKALKNYLHQHCLERVGARLDQIDQNLEALMEAKQNETKSSAGDKYETGRAMIQNEEELYKRQKSETRKVLDQLLKIDPDINCSTVKNGALVALPSGFFYISAGMGKLEVDKEHCYAISLESPLGQALSGLSAGSSFEFHQKTTQILNIC